MAGLVAVIAVDGARARAEAPALRRDEIGVERTARTSGQRVEEELRAQDLLGIEGEARRPGEDRLGRVRRAHARVGSQRERARRRLRRGRRQPVALDARRRGRILARPDASQYLRERLSKARGIDRRRQARDEAHAGGPVELGVEGAQRGGCQGPECLRAAAGVQRLRVAGAVEQLGDARPERRARPFAAARQLGEQGALLLERESARPPLLDDGQLGHLAPGFGVAEIGMQQRIETRREIAAEALLAGQGVEVVGRAELAGPGAARAEGQLLERRDRAALGALAEQQVLAGVRLAPLAARESLHPEEALRHRGDPEQIEREGRARVAEACAEWASACVEVEMSHAKAREHIAGRQRGRVRAAARQRRARRGGRDRLPARRRPRGNQRIEEVLEPGGLGGQGVPRGDPRAGRGAEPCAQRGVVRQAGEGDGERRHLAFRHEQARLAVLEQLDDAAVRARDDRELHRARLHQGDGQALHVTLAIAAAGQAEDLCRGHRLAHGRGRLRTQEAHARTQRRRLPLERLA